jgi:hypothetical protein
MPIASVLRISQTGNLTETLFSTQRDPSQNGVIPLPGEAVRFVLFGWDLNAEGDLIYADPAGLNKVNIRYSTDGRDAELRLPNPPEDVLDFRKLLDSLPSAANRANVPRIASVRWLDSEYFMTRPAAKWAPPTIETAGVFDVYSREGQSYGRFNISIPYDPSNDEIFIRGDLLILIQGGKSVARAHFALLSQTEPDLPEPSDVEEIRVRVYRLFNALRER